jgi:CcmD family protein
MKKIAALILTLLVSVNLFAQQNVSQDVPMADRLREDGKIWVVVVVIAVVFVGIIAYLVSIDRKISKLEKQIKP